MCASACAQRDGVTPVQGKQPWPEASEPPLSDHSDPLPPSPPPSPPPPLQPPLLSKHSDLQGLINSGYQLTNITQVHAVLSETIKCKSWDDSCQSLPTFFSFWDIVTMSRVFLGHCQGYLWDVSTPLLPLSSKMLGKTHVRRLFWSSTTRAASQRSEVKIFIKFPMTPASQASGSFYLSSLCWWKSHRCSAISHI